MPWYLDCDDSKFEVGLDCDEDGFTGKDCDDNDLLLGRGDDCDGRVSYLMKIVTIVITIRDTGDRSSGALCQHGLREYCGRWILGWIVDSAL